MKIAIIQFPGSNCERETILAVKRAGMEPIEFLWNESHDKLREMDGYIIVGGFSYEDRSRAGIIAALDPVMLEIKAQHEKGKPILGICNGAQILVETGLVPGLENNKLGMVLTDNKRTANGKILGTGYYNAWVHIRLSDPYQRNAFTLHLSPHQILKVPVAHGEGRFVMSEALLQEIEHQGIHVFQYCDDEGQIIDQFPINPNGSLLNIAALSNKAGNVMAMMPHPERTKQGDVIFQSMRDYIREGRTEQSMALYYYPRPRRMTTYARPHASQECIVQLIITDNQALTVQNTLHQLKIPVTVERQTHWEIHCDPDQFQQIKQSGVLYNERKEEDVSTSLSIERDHSRLTFLVRPKENVLGQQKMQMLKDHFAIEGIHAIYYGVLWHFSYEKGSISDLKDQILQTNIISNPYAHECYEYLKG